MADLILDNNIVNTASEYFGQLLECDYDDIPVDWENTGDNKLITLEQFNAVGDIIALQVSFWCLRRLGNSCESNCDYIQSMIRNKISEYETKYEPFLNNNKDNIW